jgi:hypothetical protein
LRFVELPRDFVLREDAAGDAKLQPEIVFQLSFREIASFALKSGLV